uniref:Structural constituent of cuticle n=1 Tax=Anopheles atroparvus TaxID=41427 RepID=A0AAG5DKU7_ANOAO
MGVLGAIVVAIVVRMVAGNTMAVHVSQPNAEVYHRQDMKKGEFDYGYHVQTVSNQFQHKVKGPDDVTYGCYGYIDPSNRKHLVYYVADRMGYRIIFPNRPTKIFSATLSDSLNKLDGSVKGKDYDEKLVQWNDLYMPDSCFRLHEILQPAASNQGAPQTVEPNRQPSQYPGGSPPAGPVKTAPVSVPAPELPRPTQYTIPTTARTLLDLTGAGSEQHETATDQYEEQQPEYGGGLYVQVGQQQQGGQPRPQPQQPVWQGSIPDINPANINLDQFSGHVYPIYTGTVDVQGQSGVAAQFSATQQSLNITQLLAQIEAVNSQVITLNMVLAGMANNPTAFGQANENSCRSVVQLLKTQHRTPQLVYVPILIPYTEGQYNINQPIVPAQRDAYRKPHHG